MFAAVWLTKTFNFFHIEHMQCLMARIGWTPTAQISSLKFIPKFNAYEVNPAHRESI